MSDSQPPETPAPAPAPGDQLVHFLDQLVSRLEEAGLVETDPDTKRLRLSAGGRRALGAPRRTGVFERDLVGHLFRLAAACDLDVPHVL